MKSPLFQPGFRFSAIDAGIIVLGATAALAFWPIQWQFGFVIAFVVAHFFLFCNVFRVSRLLELLWSGVFIALTVCTTRFETPNWWFTTIASLLATIAVVAVEMRKPSYHGVFWRRVNPRLPEWWAARDSTKSS